MTEIYKYYYVPKYAYEIVYSNQKYKWPGIHI